MRRRKKEEAKKYLGIDIGGTKCAVVLGDENGKILEKVKFPTGTAAETVERLLIEAEHIGSEAVSIGISCGGPLDPELGIIESPPNLPGWRSVPIKDKFEQRLGKPALLCNDANACALAEWTFGAGIGTKNMIFLTFGTGLGAGIILDGRIYNGTNGNAGEVGHIRLERFGPIGYGKQGSFEGFCSGGGIAMAARNRAIERLQRGEKTGYCASYEELESVTAQTVADAARRADIDAVLVYRQCGEMLGRGLAILVDILNPELIVIGSIYQRATELLAAPMERTLREEALEDSYDAVKVVPAALGDELGDLAAIALARSCGGLG